MSWTCSYFSCKCTFDVIFPNYSNWHLAFIKVIRNFQMRALFLRIITLSLLERLLYWKLHSFSDWRVKKWLFLSSPFPVVGILVCYLSVLYLGQKFMRPQPAFSLRKVLFVYNIIQMTLSCYIVKEVSVLKSKDF